MSKKVFIASDLHIGWEKSCIEDIIDDIKHLPDEADIIICDGDFVHAKNPELLASSFAVVQAYAQQYPEKEIRG